MARVDIDQLAGNIGWKDRQLRHLGCNNQLAQSLQLKSPAHIIGLQDGDLLAHSEQDAHFHYQYDQLALQGKTSKFVHFFQGSHYFATKKPLQDHDNQIVGVIYHCLPLENHEFFTQLMNVDKQYCPDTKARVYRIQPDTNPFDLSARELQCIFYLLRGKTSKQMAAILGLSKRTIDAYVDNIKNKLGCYTRSELLVCAIEAGYMNIIPAGCQYHLSFRDA